MRKNNCCTFCTIFFVLTILNSSLAAKANSKDDPDFKEHDELVAKINKQISSNFGGFGILNSLENLTIWHMREEHIAQVLTKWQKLLRDETDLIRQYLTDYQTSSGEALKKMQDQLATSEERGAFIGSTAVLGHRMTSRFAGLLTDIRKLMNSTEYKKISWQVLEALGLGNPTRENAHDIFFRNMTEMHVMQRNFTGKENQIMNLPSNKTSVYTGPWISRRDVLMSMGAFLHIQQVHEYKPEVANSWEVAQLSVKHSMELGMFALYRKKFVDSVDWLEYAINLTDTQSSKDGSDSKDLINQLLMVSAQEHNRVLPQVPQLYNGSDPSMMFDVYGHPIKDFQNPLERETRRSELRKTYSGSKLFFSCTPHFMNLCRGQAFQSAESQKSLNCYYEQKRDPYLYINPIKVEVLSKSPPVFQFYEMIGPARTELIKKNARPGLFPLGIVGCFNPDDISILKSSVISNLPKNGSLTDWVSRMTEIVAGLKSNYMERIQYAEYTYGRFNSPHCDQFENAPEALKEVYEYGDRFGTMLYYLEEPEEGGATIFCSAGFSVRPVKGSALFWYNLYRNGLSRKNVHHGACPVLRGHKAVLTHWVRYHANWNFYKCTRDRHE